jgi:D-alanyl-D-alanine carboxypeptidase
MTNMSSIKRVKRNRIVVMAVAVGLSAIGLAVAAVMSASGPLTVAEANTRLDEALHKVVQDPEQHLHNGVMWVDAPRLGLQRGFAAGVANEATGKAMGTDTPFLSASVGKLFVAVAVMTLVQDGVLSLDDPVTKWVPAATLQGLPIGGGDGAWPTVTLRLLLGHRSGLPDYFSDPSKDGAPRLYDLIARERDRRWSRDDLFAWARAHYAPVGTPGERFHYADTNYDLLGIVLEKATGSGSFVDVVRARVLTPLALKHTWYHSLEQAPPGEKPIADAFIGDVNMHDAPSLTADQAGGGLATTVGDLRLLLRALVKGTPVPLSSLATSFSQDAMVPGIDVGLCAWRIRPGGIFFALGGLPELVGHSGSTGVWAYYVERHDAVLVGAVSQSGWQEDHIRFLLAEVLPVLERTRPGG